MTQAQALAILKTGVNVFLTGEPGSGKTHTVNEYVAYLRRRKIEPAITASTGIAATHIGGQTIHSWSGIGVRERLDKYELDRICSIERVARRIENAHVLVIDEVSMLSAGTLSMVDAVCREVRRRPEHAFGGLQVIFVGDFFQLPPVDKLHASAPVNKFAYESPAWVAANPAVCYLAEQYRQDDEVFLQILKAIRSNSFNSSHQQHVAGRKTEHGAVLDLIPKLFPHNVDVDRLNQNMLDKLPGEQEEFLMSHKGPAHLVETLQKGCLSPQRLFLKTGASVMFTKNNPKAGFVNGTLGVVSGFNSQAGLPLIKIRNRRTIEAGPVEWTIGENGRVRAKIIQLPLRLAWAITVHKSQGMSMDEAAMDLSQVFEYGQGYVALSRVRRLAGLHIFGWNERAFRVHPAVLARDSVFRASSQQAETAVGIFAAPDLAERQNNFILRCDGQIEIKDDIAEAENDLDTYSATLALWRQGKTVEEIADARELKAETILSHLEKLSRQGKVSRADLARLCTPALQKDLLEIHAAFRQLGIDRLSPIYEKFSGRYPYSTLRLARLLYQRN